MKKFVMCCIIVFSCSVLLGCGLAAPENVKTEFNLNEKASIDRYQLKLVKVTTERFNNEISSSNGQYLILTFKVKNNEKETIRITDDQFELKIDDETYSTVMPCGLSLKSKEEREYVLLYDVPIQDNYDLLFFSGIVTNNIKFQINPDRN